MSTSTIPAIPELEAAIGVPFDEWAHNCHGISIAIVKAGILDGPARVARGRTLGVMGQHSWIVLGDDCYDEDATLVDPTLWSYRDDVDGVYVGTAAKFSHTPHGAGSIWEYGRPDVPTGPIVPLAVEVTDDSAKIFLDILGPLDSRGWAVLANGPMQGWPSGVIIEAMHRTPGLSVHIPIDILGMVTDLNPSGLYLPGEDRS